MSKNNQSAEAAAPTPPQRSRKKPRSHRELGLAVLAEIDPVAVVRGLLQCESEAVKVRTLETVANWAFGSPAAAPAASGGVVRIAWHVPRPAREAPAWEKLAKSQSEESIESPSESEREEQ